MPEFLETSPSCSSYHQSRASIVCESCRSIVADRSRLATGRVGLKVSGLSAGTRPTLRDRVSTTGNHRTVES